MEQNQTQPSSPVSVSNDSLMPHQEPHNGNSLPTGQAGQVIQPSVISQAPVEVRDFITVSKSDFGVIAEPKSKKLPVVVLVLAGLIGLFILYEYMLYRSLINQGI
ncbi:MAG: hypothetical protein Q8R29_03110 [bacterium]|nr:hypothetical protein [bacterium]